MYCAPAALRRKLGLGGSVDLWRAHHLWRRSCGRRWWRRYLDARAWASPLRRARPSAWLAEGARLAIARRAMLAHVLDLAVGRTRRHLALVAWTLLWRDRGLCCCGGCWQVAKKRWHGGRAGRLAQAAREALAVVAMVDCVFGLAPRRAARALARGRGLRLGSRHSSCGAAGAKSASRHAAQEKPRG